jgi:hypothetical protein
VVAATIRGKVGLFSGITAANGEVRESSPVDLPVQELDRGPLKFIIVGEKVDLLACLSRVWWAA